MQNRTLWKYYFSEKSIYHFSISGNHLSFTGDHIIIIWILFISSGTYKGLQIIKPENKNVLGAYYTNFMGFIMLMIALRILAPLFIDIRINKAKYEAALNLMSELDEK